MHLLRLVGCLTLFLYSDNALWLASNYECKIEISLIFVDQVCSRLHVIDGHPISFMAEFGTYISLMKVYYTFEKVNITVELTPLETDAVVCEPYPISCTVQNFTLTGFIHRQNVSSLIDWIEWHRILLFTLFLF